MVRLKTARDLAGLRASGHILAELLVSLRGRVAVGVETRALDTFAREFLKKRGARPAFLGYRPEGARGKFPAAICTSLNDQIVHGVPSAYALCDGDLLKIDIGVEYRGYFTDAAITVPVGKVSRRSARLVRATREALAAALAAAKPGGHLGDLGAAIERTARRAGFRVVKGLTGHGVGFTLHEDPEVYNYGRRGEGMLLRAGLVLAIEPMVSAGSPEIVARPDGSYATADGSLAAHFEHTVAITERGAEILTE